MTDINKTLPIQIDHIDPLGQGVDKSNGEITFVAKTLPGERGSALICKSKKGVRFAKLIAIASPSKKRITPECPHFQDCPGCDYLHTDYESELAYKKVALQKSFQKISFEWGRLEVLGAPERLGYRNRIQLHYREGTLGMVDGLQDRIVEIPDCRIVHDALRPALIKLYEDRAWQKKQGDKGHCELYFHHNKVQVSWNKPYARGGFTQVNDTMNAVLREAVASCLGEIKLSSVLDLFAGDGNLSDGFVKAKRTKAVRVDTAAGKGRPDRIALDLFSPKALKVFERKWPQERFDLILLDPPRKGFPALKDWVLRYRPKDLIYVSCHPGTLARDLSGMPSGFEIARLMLIDLFPGTRHFETLAHIRFRDRRSGN